MTQILKRLEIIKSSIAIEDEEVIELQVMKLQKLEIDDEVKAIVVNLEAMNYAKAMNKIRKSWLFKGEYIYQDILSREEESPETLFITLEKDYKKMLKNLQHTFKMYCPKT